MVGLWVYFSLTFKFLYIFYNEHVLQLEWKKNNLHIKNKNQGSYGYSCFLEKHRPFHQHALASVLSHLPMHLSLATQNSFILPASALHPVLQSFTRTTLCLPSVSCLEVGSQRAWHFIYWVTPMTQGPNSLWRILRAQEVFVKGINREALKTCS